MSTDVTAARDVSEQQAREAAEARRVLDDDLTWLENGVVDVSEGTEPWIAQWRHGRSDAQDVSRRYR